MRLTIEHSEGPGGAAFVVGNGLTHTKPVSLPDPAEYPIRGYPKLRLLSALQWYLEEYLNYPEGANETKADAVVSALKDWGAEVFNRLFSAHAYQWYANARSDLDAVQIKIISNSPMVLSWPWEALYSGDDGYLAQRCCMERQPPDLEIPYSENVPLPDTDAIHILFIIARPYGKSDVGYHALAREVTDYVVRENLPVTIDVLRPPTFENLRETLKKNPGYYHIVHFDGHGGYGETGNAEAYAKTGAAKFQGTEGSLIFETDPPPAEEVGPDPVRAEVLGQLLAQYRVPMMVLNACQSAMLDERAADPFASVAASLLKAGVRSVIAMAYSLYVSGAEQFVPAFYRRLFEDGDPAGAMLAGRQRMYQKAQRNSGSLSGKTDLQDWIVPELYQQIESGERVLPRRIGSGDGTADSGGQWDNGGGLSGNGGESAEEDGLPEEVRDIGDYGFIGRGEAIHALERMLQRQKQAGILIHGMAGAGKTTLAKGFLLWLRDTGGLRDQNGKFCPVFWFDFRGVSSADYIIDELAAALLGENSRAMNAKAKFRALTDYLKKHKVYIVWDNFESASGIAGTEVTANLSEADQRKLKELLNALRERAQGQLPKTRIWITSRTRENWLAVQECARMEALDGLRDEEQWAYCNAVVSDFGITIDRKDKDLKALLDKLDGNPLAIRAILLRLAERPAGVLCKELDKAFEGAEGDESTRRIQAAFRVLCSGVDAELEPILQTLGLHEYFADADYIESILYNLENVKANTQGARKIEDRVTRCFRLLENAGLCTHMGNNLYRLHPALRGCLAVAYPPTDDVRRWFVRYLAYLENRVHNSDAQRVALYSYYEANFYHAKNIAEELGMQEEDLELTSDLASVMLEKSRFARAEALFREVAEKAHKHGNLKKEEGAYRFLSNLVTRQGDIQEGKEWMQKAADIWLNIPESERSADAWFTLGTNAKRQGNWSLAASYYKKELALREQEGNLALACETCGALGDLAHFQGNDDEAEEWYQKEWKLAKDISDYQSLAVSSRDLGHTAVRRGKPQEALKWYHMALRIYDGLEDRYNIAIVFHDLGRLYTAVGAYESAENVLLQSLRIAKKINLEPLAAQSCNDLGRLAEETGDNKSAELWFTQALSILEKLGDTEDAAIVRRNLERVKGE